MAYSFNHVHLKSPDPGKAADWYVKAFNFEIVSDTVRDGGDRFIRCRTTDGIAVNISGARTNEHMGGGDATVHWGLEHFGINVDDLVAELERLQELGAVLMEGPTPPAPTGARVAFIKAPDDTRIEVMQIPN